MQEQTEILSQPAVKKAAPKKVAKKTPSASTQKKLAIDVSPSPLLSTGKETLADTQKTAPKKPRVAQKTVGKTEKIGSAKTDTAPKTPKNKKTQQKSEQKLLRFAELSKEETCELLQVLNKAVVLAAPSPYKKAPYSATYKPAKNTTKTTAVKPKNTLSEFKELSFKTLVYTLKAKWLKKNSLDNITDLETPLLPSAPMPEQKPLDSRSNDPLTPFKGKFNKESINELPLVHYEGEICLVNTLEEIEPALELLKNDTIIGFDTETKPNFHKGKTLPPCLLQLAGENAVIIFQFKHTAFSQAMADLLNNTTIIKSGIAVADDIHGLNRLLEFKANNMIDLTAIMKKAGLETFGMRNMAANLLGIRISKSAQCSNWSNTILTPQQIRYAATDAWVSRLLYLRALELNLL